MVPSATVSEHARYRQRLGRLAAAEFGATVAELACRRGWVEPGAAAQRTYGRFEPGSSPWATMVYALGRTHVQVDTYDERDDDRPADAVADLAGPVLVRLIQDVDAVAGLGAYLRDHPDAAVVRYRPGRRCVLRAGDRFVKLVRPDVGVGYTRRGVAFGPRERPAGCRSASMSPIAGMRSRAPCGRAWSPGSRSQGSW